MASRPPSRLHVVMMSNLDDLRSPFFWRGVVAEIIGTFLLVFIGCSSYIWWPSTSSPAVRPVAPSVLQISFTFGLAAATIVYVIGHISGGYINPAVTIGMLVARRISLVRAVLFIVAQCGGAIAGAALLYALAPPNALGSLGATNFQEETTSTWQAFLIELIGTFVLVSTVFAITDWRRTDVRGSGPFAVGLSVAVCHLFAINYTKAGFNPARSIGPAVLMNKDDIWNHHWVYWCAPLVGGVVAALLYETILASNVSLTKNREFLLSSTYDPDTFERTGEYTVTPRAVRRSTLGSEDYLKGYDEQPIQ